MRKIELDLDKVLPAYKEFKSLKKTAESFSVSEETIRRFLKANSIKRIPRGCKAGTENHQHKGGSRSRKDGYTIIRGSREKPLQHRVIAEQVLGRKLAKGEVVHHINCDKSDNRPENLLICTHAYHMALHARMRKDPYWSQVAKAGKSINHE